LILVRRWVTRGMDHNRRHHLENSGLPMSLLGTATWLKEWLQTRKKLVFVGATVGMACVYGAIWVVDPDAFRVTENVNTRVFEITESARKSIFNLNETLTPVHETEISKKVMDILDEAIGVRSKLKSKQEELDQLSAKMDKLDLESRRPLAPQERALQDDIYKLKMSLPNLNGQLGVLQNRYLVETRAKLGPVDFLYFSIGAATTATFGDIAPNHWLVRLCVCIQVVLSVVLMGLVIDDLSKK